MKSNTSFHTKKIKLFFYQVSLKFSGYLKSNHKQNIFLEFIREDLQNYLLHIVLDEFLFLVLELRKAQIKKQYSFFVKTDFILKVLIINSETCFRNSFPFEIKQINYKLNDALWLIKLLETEEDYCIKILFNYLVFEDTKMLNDNKFSDKFTRILIEHLVLKITETLIRLLLTQSILDSYMLKSYPKSNLTFNRIITQFRNDLYWSSYLNLIFTQPKCIHNNIHPIWIILNKKICFKNIFLFKIQDELKLTNLQVYILLYLETIDFLKFKLKQLLVPIKKD